MIYMAAPKGLFPPEPEHYRGPKLKVAIIGAGLAGMSTAVELLDQGHEVWPILFYPSQMLTICLLCFLQISNGLIIPPFHHFFFFWKWRIRYKISILGYSAKFFQQKCTREYFIFCYFNAFSLWGYSLPLFYLFFCIFRWIYTSQGLLLVEKWVLLLTDVGTTLKWDCMFSLVAIIIFSVWWKRWT